MTAPTIRLSLPIECAACQHSYTINPVGVQTWTDVVCPGCGVVDHLSQATINQVEQELMEGLGDVYEDEEEYQAAIAFWYEADDKERATVINDGY